MANRVTVVQNSREVSNMADKELNLSEEEQALLRQIRDEREQLSREIQELRVQIADIDNELSALEEVKNEDDRQERLTQQRWKTGRNKFNAKPKDGIKYLVEEGLIKETSDAIAEFLYKEDMLNMVSVGEYLGENHDLNIEVLKKLVGLHKLDRLSLVDALREFLSSFHLPGEGQKIDRIMEHFAQGYCAANPTLFSNSDTCYVLAYAIIMLNTSLHNPSVKNKPTLESFISMNRGIDNGSDLPPELLTEFFEDIRREQFKIPGMGNLAETFFNPEKEGWLTKEGGKYKTKHRRWFILKDNILYYFKQPSDSELTGSIPLDNLSVREVSEACFEIFAQDGVIKAWKKDSEGKVVKGNHDVYRLVCDTKEEKDDWIKSIQASVAKASIHDTLKEKRQKLTNDLQQFDYLYFTPS
ncbi:cytohesin-1-like [Dysidea avara]|uniref:cytohesin-1-like n=1 Tax=Dysidea avara TaxID=196820 RepID=UPI0033225951